MSKYTVGGWIIRNEVYALSIKAPLSSANESYAHFKLQFDEETPNVGLFNSDYSFEYEQTESPTETRGIFSTNHRKLICTLYASGENSIELTESDLSSILVMVNVPVEVLDILFKIGNREEDTIDAAFRGNGESSENNPTVVALDGSVRGGRRSSRKPRKTRRRQARK
jgi:hypothetical protein